MTKFRKIGYDFYQKVGTVKNGNVFDRQGKNVGNIGKQVTINKNKVTEITGKHDSFKIINDNVYNSKNQKIGTLSQFKSMIDGSVSSNEIADIVGFICLVIGK